jgi:MFS family permease
MSLAVAQLVSWGTLYYAFALFIAPLEREQGWSRTEITGALTAGLLATALASPLAGRAIDRMGGRLPMACGSLAATLLLLAWAAVERLATFYLVWVGLGIAMAFVLYDAVFALLARTQAGGYRRAVTLVTLVAGFASTVFLPLAHLLIEQLGWRGALVALAALNLAVPGSVHLLVPPRLVATSTSAGRVDRDPAPVRRVVRGRAFWGILIAVVANATLFSAVTFHLVPLLSERGVALPTIVAVAALVGPAQVAARLGLLALERRLTLRAASLLAAALPVAGTLVLTAVGPLSPLLWIFPLLYGAGNGMMTIVRAAAIADLLGRSSFGAINGAIALPALVGTAVAPVAAAQLWYLLGGYDGVLAALLGLALTSVAGLLWATSAGRSGPQTGASGS